MKSTHLSCVVLILSGGIGVHEVSAATIALVNSPTGNASVAINLKSFVEARGDTFVRNPTSYAGVDTVINIRQPVGIDLANFVLGGGLMITEYTGIKNAGNGTGNAGLLNYTDTGGSLAVTAARPVTFTIAGIALGLNSGLSNPYVDGVANEFYRNGIVVGAGVSVLATRPLGASTTPSIVGATAGNGYVLGIAYDWADAFVTTGSAQPLLQTQQLLTNALAIPEPTTLSLLAGAGMLALRRRRA